LAKFVQDISYPDNTLINPGTSFTKTWRLKNVGSCAWDSSYQIVFVSGDSMSAPITSPWTGATIDYGGVVDISVNMVAPSMPGAYQGYFVLLAPDGITYVGLGVENKPFWTKIVVNSPPPVPLINFSPSYQDVYTDYYVPCPYYYVELNWNQPYDASGIDLYEVKLDMDYGMGWVTVIDQNVSHPQTQLEITNAISSYCPANLHAQIRARDRGGLWSDWDGLYWQSEVPPVPTPAIISPG